LGQFFPCESESRRQPVFVDGLQMPDLMQKHVVEDKSPDRQSWPFPSCLGKGQAAYAAESGNPVLSLNRRLFVTGWDAIAAYQPGRRPFLAKAAFRPQPGKNDPWAEQRTLAYIDTWSSPAINYKIISRARSCCGTISKEEWRHPGVAPGETEISLPILELIDLDGLRFSIADANLDPAATYEKRRAAQRFDVS
jgi:hypothetical protein